MADGEDLFGNQPLIEEGDWAGWRLWQGIDPYEDLTGPYYSRVEPDGSVVCAYRLERRHMNGGGFMHGGAMMTFADFCLFVIGRPALKDQYAVTVSLNGEFVGPAHEGEVVEGRGEIVRAGGSLIFLRGLISTGDRTLMSFSGVVKKVGKRLNHMGNLLIYIPAAVAEISGCFAFWAWLRLGRSPLWLIPGCAALGLFAYLLTRTSAAEAGRSYATYGGIYIVASLVWMELVEGARPDRWDLIGAAFCLVGAAIILLGPRPA